MIIVFHDSVKSKFLPRTRWHHHRLQVLESCLTPNSYYRRKVNIKRQTITHIICLFVYVFFNGDDDDDDDDDDNDNDYDCPLVI